MVGEDNWLCGRWMKEDYWASGTQEAEGLYTILGGAEELGHMYRACSTGHIAPKRGYNEQQRWRQQCQTQ